MSSDKVSGKLGSPHADGKELDAPGTRSVDRAFAILGVFREVDIDLGVNDVARRLSLTSSTVHRIMRVLTRQGYLAQDHETEDYHLGRGAYLLGQAASRRLGLYRALPVLQRTVALSGESVNLGMRDGDEMVVLAHAESEHTLRISQRPGSRLPVHASGMGKAAMAYVASIEDEVAALAKPLRVVTANTIVSAEKLTAELQATRDRGYSLDDEEAILGVRCVGAPVVSANGHVIAALAIQGPAVRMSPLRMQELASLAIAAAKEVAEVLPASADELFNPKAS